MPPKINGLDGELAVALRAARAAGKIMLDYYKHGVAAETKADGTPVTIADRECERAIVETIASEFPYARFLSEEASPNERRHAERWIVDPIDGTRNFVNGIPRFGSIIAFEKQGEVVLGVMTDAPSRLVVHARKGNGAFANGKRLRVSKTTKLEKAKFGTQSFEYVRAASKIRAIKDLLKLAKTTVVDFGLGTPRDHYELARGAVDVLVSTGKPWDASAPKIITEEAGGRFTDVTGKPTIYSQSGLFLAANPTLHSKVLEMI